MRILDIILEKKVSPVDQLIPQLQQMGYNVERKSGNLVKVVVPRKDRNDISQKIVNAFPNSTVDPTNNTIIRFNDGSRIEVKPKESQSGGRNYETGQIGHLQKLIKELCEKNGVNEIELHVGKTVIPAAGIKKMPEGIKADVAIIDAQGNEQAWVSLKKGPGPSAIAGWGGVSHLGKDVEIRAFVDKAKALFPIEFPRGPTYSSPIANDNIKKLVVFGKEFGKEFGPSNVNIVLQGMPIVTGEATYRLEGDTNTWVNGTLPSGEYDPILCIRYGDRNDFGVTHGRIFMNPKGGRPTVNIDSIKPNQ